MKRFLAMLLAVMLVIGLLPMGVLAAENEGVSPASDEEATVYYNITVSTDAKGEELGFDKTTFYTTANGGSSSNNGNADSIKFNESYSVTQYGGSNNVVWRTNDTEIVKSLVSIDVTVDGATASLQKDNIGEGSSNFTYFDFATTDVPKKIKVCKLNSGANSGKYQILIESGLYSDTTREITIKYVFDDSANFTLRADSKDAAKGSVLGVEYLKHKDSTTDIYRVYTSATEGNRLNGYTLGNETVLLLDSEKITGTYGEDNTNCVYFDIELTDNSEITVNFDGIPAASDGWDGTVDTSWYKTTDTEFTLTTPAQLAGLAAIVNGKASGITEDFTGKTIKLGADIKLNDVDFAYSADVNRVKISKGETSVYEALTVDKGTGDSAPENVAFTFYTSKSGSASVASRSDDKQVSAGGLSWRVWEPIGNSEKPFKGTVDGQNHSITNMYYAGYGKNCQNIGLFGNVNGTIKNLAVAGVVAGTNNVGGIAGLADNSTIENCTNQVTVIGTTYDLSGNRAGAGSIGGVVGKVNTSDGTFTGKNLKNNGVVLGYAGVGGIAGTIEGTKKITFKHCINTALVSGYSLKVAVLANIGGVLGKVANSSQNTTDVSVELDGLGNQGNINTLDIEGYNQYVSGVIGTLDTSQSISDIKNCYNTGDVNSRTLSGGIIGYHYCTGSYPAYFSNAYNAGKVSWKVAYKTGNDQYVNEGSVVGRFMQSPGNNANNVWKNIYQVEDSLYIAGEVSSASGYTVGLTELTGKEMKVAAFPARLGDAFVVDKSNVNKGYPVLIGDSVSSNAKAITEFKLGDTKGTIDDTAKTITFNDYAVSASDDRIFLKPVISVSDKATASPASGEVAEFVQDGTDKTLYTAEYLVTAENGSVTTYTVKVYTKAAVSSVDVSMYSISVIAGYGNYQLSATVAPVNAANQKVTWSSSYPAIATVDQTGLVTGVSAGTTTITVTSEDGGKTKTCEVTVQPFVAVTSIALPETAAVSKSQTIELTPTFTPSNASNQEATWSSSALTVATVDENGVVTGMVDSGTAVITVTAKDTTGGTISASCTVTVKELPLEGISVTQTKTLAVGKGKKLKVTFNPTNASNKTVTWKSSNSSVATVDKDGVVRGVATGEATITATAADTTNGTLTATVKLNVVSDYDYTVGWAGAFNANDNNNNAATVALPTPDNAVEENWYAPVGNSAVCVVGDYVYAYACAQGMNGFDMKGNVKSFYKIDKYTGNIVTEIKNCPGAGGYYYGYVLYGGGLIYVVCPNVVMAFDIDACEMLWSQSITYRQYCSAQYVNGCVIANGCVVDGATGELKTKLNGKYCYSSGAVVGDNFYIAGYDGYLHAFDTTTWTETDSYQFGSDQGETEGWNIKLESGVLYHQGRFYWSSRSGLYSIALNGGKLDPDSYKFLSGPQSSVCTPVAYGNRVYLAGQMGQIDVYSTETLELVYSTNRLSGQKLQSTPIIYGSGDDAYIYVQGYSDSAIYCLHDTATATSGKLELLVTPSQAQYAFEQIACDKDGALYCTNDAGYLFRFAAMQANLPSITTDLSTDPVTYTKGASNVAALTVTATVEGDYTLSYQWQSSENDVASEYADIEGATNSSYTPDISKVGTTFYRCKVVSSAGTSVYVLSNSAQIRVEEGTNNGGNGNGGETPAEKTVPVTINFSMDGKLKVYNAKLDVRDTDGDKKYTMHDAFYVLHEKYNDVDNYEGSASGWVTKFWGDTSQNYGYTQNHKWVNGANQVINSGDKLDVYILQDTSSDYSDLLTWFSKDNYTGKTGNEITFTVNGMYLFGSNGTNKQVKASPEGATVTITNPSGAKSTAETDEDGKFTLSFPDAGTYTIDVSGECSFSVSDGEYSGSTYTNAPVVPSRCTVTISGTSTGGSIGGATAGSAESTEENVTTVNPSATANKDGEATANVGSGTMKDAISNAKSDGSSTIVIEPEVKGDANKVTVNVPVSSAASVGKDAKADLTVKTDVGTITLPAEELKNLSGSGNLTISAEAKENGEVEVNITKGGEDVEMKNISVTVPAEIGKTNAVLVLVHEDGTEEVLKKSVVTENGVTGLVDGSCTVKAVEKTADFGDTVNHWAKSAAEFVANREIFKGTGEKSFSPDLSMSRAMVATVLHRLENAPKANGKTNYTDKLDAWAEDGIAWATENEIVTGYAGIFDGNRPVTRQELATMLYRYAKVVGLNTDSKGDLSKFTDGSATADWAKEAMIWAVQNGLLTGKPNNALDPAGTASRAEVAAVIQRLIGLMVK